MSHFKLFGCISHVRVPDTKRAKRKYKSCKCIFLRVSDESNAYRLYDPVENKIVVSKDVIFEEGEQWDWDKNHQAEVATDLDWGETDTITKEEEDSEESDNEDA